MIRACRAAILSIAALTAAAAVVSTSAQAHEVRGLWVVRTALTSPASVSAMVAAARDAGVNTLIVQVRGRGDAYYASRIEPRASALAAQPSSFDPLASVLVEARAAGLAVHAWVNVNLAADAGFPPADPRHVVNRHPEWLMVPMELAASIGDPRGSRFVATLASWTRKQTASVEGLYTSPISDGAADHLANVVRDLVARYAVDGVHFDYVRYPGAAFDYSREALRAFRAEVAPELPRQERETLDRRQRTNPLVWAQMYPRRWEAFRRAKLTVLVGRLRAVVAEHRPAALVSAAVVPDAQTAVDAKFQDWPAWAADGVLDALCPMTYATDLDAFRLQVASAQSASGGRPVWAGIGAYRLSADEALDQIREARALGVDGVLLFSYDSLVSPARGPDNLARIGAQAFTQ
ncbi:MAG: family 10 glycosylhydrolase [Vicinamibacterales bacterium]